MAILHSASICHSNIRPGLIIEHFSHFSWTPGKLFFPNIRPYSRKYGSTTVRSFHVTLCSTNHGRFCYQSLQGQQGMSCFYDSLVAARGKTSDEHDVLWTFAGRVNNISAIHCVLQGNLPHTSLAGRLAKRLSCGCGFSTIAVRTETGAANILEIAIACGKTKPKTFAQWPLQPRITLPHIYLYLHIRLQTSQHSRDRLQR